MMLITSESFFGLTPIHFEALMLALFNRLRALWFVLLGPFCPSAFTEPSGCCDPGGLSRVEATEAAVLSTSLFWPEFSSLGAQTRSLRNKMTRWLRWTNKHHTVNSGFASSPQSRPACYINKENEIKKSGVLKGMGGVCGWVGGWMDGLLCIRYKLEAIWSAPSDIAELNYIPRCLSKTHLGNEACCLWSGGVPLSPLP